MVFVSHSRSYLVSPSNEDEVIAELQSVTAKLSKSRQAIQLVELVELSELNRQALERAALNSASSGTHDSLGQTN